MGLFKLGQAGLAGSTTTTVNLPTNAATDYKQFLILLRASAGSGAFGLRLNSHTTYYSNYNSITNTSYGNTNDTSSTTTVPLGSVLSDAGTYLANCVIEIHNPNGASQSFVSGLWQWGVNNQGATASSRFGAFNADGLSAAVTSITITASAAPTYGIFYIYGMKSDG